MNNVMQKLKLLCDKEVLRPIDVELCRFLSEQHPDISKDVLLAAAMVSHLYRQGHVCLPLEDYAGQSLFEEAPKEFTLKAPDLNKWRSVLQDSPAVGTPGDYKPLILDGSDRIYMHKLWHYEHSLAQELIRKGNHQVENIDEQLLTEGLERLFDESSEQPDWQKVAAATSVRNKLSVISGGPGTGKTSTVVRILALILEQCHKSDMGIDIALAAPTGKAAARLKDSIMEAREDLDITDDIRALIPENAQTLHQLLGARRHSARFRHNAENPIPYDLVIVDEASMVDQALMSKLLGALLDDTRLILLGDKDQLASVEAGSVLGDICKMDENMFSQENINWLNKLSISIPDQFLANKRNALIDNITLLTKSYRFASDSGIAQLSEQINKGNADGTIEVFKNSNFNDVSLLDISKIEDMQDILTQWIPDFFEDVLTANSPKEALQRLNRFRILAAHRKGPSGIIYLNQLVEKILHKRQFIPKYAQWYPGKPVIVNVNDYTLGLFNGDIGICFADADGNLNVYFEDDDTVRGINPARLPNHNTAYALTVHKSQGSEFDEVLFIPPRTTSKVMSRELIYTAITRARTQITIAGSKKVLREGIQRRIHRSSGLSDYLWSE